jgi:hypothetical protein
VDEAGQPVADVSIYANAPDALSGGQATTDAEGRFRIEPLAAGAPYSASMTRPASISHSDDLGKACENLTLEPGEVRDLGDVRVKLPVRAAE